VCSNGAYALRARLFAGAPAKHDALRMA